MDILAGTVVGVLLVANVASVLGGMMLAHDGHLALRGVGAAARDHGP